ncbi:MAG: hypothetical protein Q9166_004908 [cf. Caloplaca sp. 2 TL-2023]
MLANPSVLFLDEVTTGLDAASAFQLIKTLKLLASKGRTIIVTIHQPGSEIWGLFDRLVLLSGGASVYSGPARDCLQYFENLGFSLPAFVNPAEFLVDLAAVDIRSSELERASAQRVDTLKQAWRTACDHRASWITDEKIKTEPTHAKSKAGRKHASLSRQVAVLTARTFKITYQDPVGFVGSLIEAIIMAVLTGWIFLNLDGSLAGIRSREGAIYTAAALQGYLILFFETYRLTIDIELFDREYAEKVVSVPSFLISCWLARVFIEDLPVPLMFSVIFYFMADKETATREKVRSLILNWDASHPPIAHTISQISAPAELGSFARSPIPFTTAFPILLHRSIINLRHSPPALVARTSQVFGFAVILTLFFAPLQLNTYSIQTRLGFIQEFAALYFVDMLQNVAVYPTEKAVFYREHDDNAYGVTSFFLTYTILETPFEITTSLFFALLTVVAAGLPRTVGLFFIEAFSCFAIVSCGGIMFNTLFAHTGFAVNVTSVILSLATIMGGVMSLHIPAFLQAWNHLSPEKWNLGNLAPYTLRGLHFTCPDGGEGCGSLRTGKKC